MLNPFQLLKAVKGGMGPDEFAELLSAAGLECSFTPVAASAEAFAPLAGSAMAEGARVIELKGKIGGGGSVHALLVFGA
jgi:hypothetical protein